MKHFGIIGLLFAFLAVPMFAADDVTYLALGDSVPFGMNATLIPPYSSAIPTASEFIGYPETVAAARGLKSNQEMNISCPGETSGSFLNTAVPDNGCNSPHIIPGVPGVPGVPPYPAIVIPPIKDTPSLLHTPYSGAQMA